MFLSSYGEWIWRSGLSQQCWHRRRPGHPMLHPSSLQSKPGTPEFSVVMDRSWTGGAFPGRKSSSVLSRLTLRWCADIQWEKTIRQIDLGPAKLEEREVALALQNSSITTKKTVWSEWPALKLDCRGSRRLFWWRYAECWMKTASQSVIKWKRKRVTGL